MSLERVSPILSIITNISVIAGIMFLAYELNQNTATLQNSSYQSVLATLTDWDRTLATDEDLNRIIREAENSPENLSMDEWSRFERYGFSLFGIWEYIFLSNQQNALSDLQWTAFEPYFLAISCSPGYRSFWKKNSHGYSPEFKTYVEREVLIKC